MPFAASATYFLRPLARLRAGSHAADLSRAQLLPSSDSLFGALTWALQLCRGNAHVEEWISRFIGREPPLLLSSAFPATLELLTLVPRPVRRLQFPDGVVDRKYLDDVAFVDASLFGWIFGEPGEVPPKHNGILVGAQRARELGWARDGAMAGTAQAGWRLQERPRVTVDRATSRSEVYRSTATTFAGSAGMAVHVLANADSDLALLDELLAVLSETGLGGEKSSGFGQFTWQRIPAALPLAAEPHAGPLLSLLSPSQEEVQAGLLNVASDRGYRLVERTGWISSPVWSSHRARTVAMLGEGSYVSPTMAAPVGNMADVTPEVPLAGRHRVYRYGFGLFLDEARI